MDYERCREIFDYRDGKLYWKIKTGKKSVVGRKVGSITPGGYIETRVDNERHYIHRLVWLWHHGYLPENYLDHINRDRADNRIENLREVSQSCNIRNSNLSKASTSGFTGVSYSEARGKWEAYIKVDYKKINLGRHNTIEEAIRARYDAEIKYNFKSCNARSACCAFVEG